MGKLWEEVKLLKETIAQLQKETDELETTVRGYRLKCEKAAAAAKSLYDILSSEFELGAPMPKPAGHQATPRE
jgi:hypothetical protein